MVSTQFHHHSFDLTQTTTGTVFTIAQHFYLPKKVESRKERIARIAKERLKASWKTHNQKSVSVIQVKRVCKPEHRLNNGRF